MNKKGFTLVELLVVIAIIGILSSVAVINLNSARNKAKAAAAQATLAQLTTPIIVCADAGSTLNLSGLSATGVESDNSLCNSKTAVNVNWPKINQHGFNYNAGGSSQLTSGLTWNVMARNTVAGLTDIICAETGCAIQ